MGRPCSITLLALATSAVAGVIVGWVGRGPDASGTVSRVLGGKPGRALALHADAPTSAASLTAARSAVTRGDFEGFLEALERVAAQDLPVLWETYSAAFPLTSDWHAALLDRWAELDPEAGLQALAGHAFDAVTSSQLRTTLFTAWAGYRPVEAASALARIPVEEPGRAALVAAVLAAVMADHPAVFLREAAAMKAAFPYEFDSRAPEAAARLAFEDPALAVALAERFGGFDREAIQRGAVLGWAGQDATAAETWVRTWPTEDQDLGLRIIARVLAAQDDVEAAGRLLGRIDFYAHPYDPEAPSSGKLAPYTWPYNSREPLELLLPRQLREDPVAALEWARRYIPAQADSRIGRALAAQPPARLESAMATLMRLDSVALAETAKAGGLAIQDPALVDRLAEMAARFSPDQRDAGRTALLASVARANPETAAPQLLEQPASPERDRVLEKAFTRWTDEAPEAATTWLGSLPAGETRDRLVWRSIEVTATADPPAAWAWLMTTADTKQRTDCYDDALSAWARMDPAAARAALDSLRVEEKTRKYLSEVVEEHSR